jgi:uncharacterized FlaG/YvyC family protein
MGDTMNTNTTNNYVYPQFVIDEKTGQVKINLIEEGSGRVVRHIPSTELNVLLRDYCSVYGITPADRARSKTNGLVS